jgi:RNA polymerase sigma-70 factor (ECF subfamily)
MPNKLSRPVERIEEIVQRDGDRLYRAAVAVTGNKAEAEDIVQDVFLKLIEKQPRFESPEHETAWLLRVTINLCKNRIRSYWWRKTETLLDTYPTPNSRETDLMQTVQALPQKYRVVIHLFYYEGYSTQEIAQITEQKESTIRQQLTRARRMLKNFLEAFL